jgi:hypothetical protein
MVAVPVQDLQRFWQRRFAQIPILSMVKLAQFIHQTWHIDIIVIVKMAKPPAKFKIGFVTKMLILIDNWISGYFVKLLQLPCCVFRNPNFWYLHDLFLKLRGGRTKTDLLHFENQVLTTCSNAKPLSSIK